MEARRERESRCSAWMRAKMYFFLLLSLSLLYLPLEPLVGRLDYQSGDRGACISIFFPSFSPFPSISPPISITPPSDPLSLFPVDLRVAYRTESSTILHFFYPPSLYPSDGLDANYRVEFLKDPVSRPRGTRGREDESWRAIVDAWFRSSEL